MAIEFRCECGARLSVDEMEAGQLVRCDACGLDIPVPSLKAFGSEAAAMAPRVPPRAPVEHGVSEEAGANPEEDLESALQDMEGPDVEEEALAHQRAIRHEGYSGTTQFNEDSATELEPKGPPDIEPPGGATDGVPPAEADRNPPAASEAATQLEDLEAHRQAEEAMIAQVDEARGQDHEVEAARHREDLGTLQKEVGTEDAAQETEKRKAASKALREQLGSRGGFSEMAEALRGTDNPPGAPQAGAKPAPTAAELGPRTRRPQSRRPPTGYARAAHHIGFKRIMWMPTLVIGLLCMGLGGYCFLPGKEANPYQQHLDYFHSQLKEANIGEFDVVRYQNHWWAIPNGTKILEEATAKVYYINISGYTEPAVMADDYQKAQEWSGGRSSSLLMYGVGLLAVGVVLAVLSAWMLHDVRVVARARPPEAKDEKPAAQGPVSPVILDEPPVAEEVAPPPDAEAGQAEDGPREDTPATDNV